MTHPRPDSQIDRLGLRSFDQLAYNNQVQQISNAMKIPARNMVEIVDLSPSDALLPILECVSNSVLSLDQSGIPVKERNIDVEIVRGEPQQAGLFGGGIKPIKDVIVTDNGIGFNDKNLESFETPHSNVLRTKYGCLGVGRFTVLAVFQKMKIRSNYPVNGHWKYRELDFDVENEVRIVADKDSNEQINKTVVEIQEFSNETMREKTAVPVEAIAREMMEHFLIFYLSDNLPILPFLSVMAARSKALMSFTKTCLRKMRLLLR
jgi:hypothetical protein